MNDLTESQKGMIVGAHLFGASEATVANVVGVSKVTMFNVIRAYSMHGQTTSAKQNSCRKTIPWSHSKCEEAYPVVQGPQEWTQKQWKQVMWSDESTFTWFPTTGSFYKKIVLLVITK
ncbi:hypothetical protein C0J52_28452 [Blattella germanica]|nr:hypothetical protein C0J52_28452 [Blattella germanica]